MLFLLLSFSFSALKSFCPRKSFIEIRKISFPLFEICLTLKNEIQCWLDKPNIHLFICGESWIAEILVFFLRERESERRWERGKKREREKWERIVKMILNFYKKARIVSSSVLNLRKKETFSRDSAAVKMTPNLWARVRIRSRDMYCFKSGKKNCRLFKIWLFRATASAAKSTL